MKKLILLSICLIFFNNIIFSQGDAAKYIEKCKKARENERYDSLLIYANKAIEIKPDLAEAYYQRAWYFWSKKKWNDVKSDFEKAIELKPDYSKAHFDLAFLLKNEKIFNDIEGAKKHFDLALKYTINNSDEQYSIYLTYGTFLDERLQEFEKAKDLFLKALNVKDQPDYSGAYFQLSKIYKDHYKDKKEIGKEYYLKATERFEIYRYQNFEDYYGIKRPSKIKLINYN